MSNHSAENDIGKGTYKWSRSDDEAMADQEAVDRLLASWPNDRAIVEAYLTHLRGTTSHRGSDGLKPSSIHYYIRGLRKVHDVLGPLETWTPARLDGFWANSTDYNITVTGPYKRALSRFVGWMVDTVTDRDEAERFARMVKSCRSTQVVRKLAHHDLLTPEDVEKLLKAAGKTASPGRDRALVAVLWESAARPAEITWVNVGDVKIGSTHATLSFPKSKTVPRTIALVESLPYLREWLRQHPNPKPDSPLFVSFKNTNVGGRLGRRSINDILLRVAQGADIAVRPPLGNTRTGAKHIRNKGLTGYIFRHSRITWCLNALGMRMVDVARMAGTSVIQIEKTYGKWIERHTVDPYLTAMGIKKEDDGKPVLLKALECPACSLSLPPQTPVCPGCDEVLDARLKRSRDREAKELGKRVLTMLLRMDEDERNRLLDLSREA